MKRRLLQALLVCALGLSIYGASLMVEASGRAHLRAPPPTLILLDRHDRFLAEVARRSSLRAPLAGRSDELGYWPVDPIPTRVADAMIAIEDKNFWGHRGVDMQAILRAVWQNLSTGRRISGASTIAMQVARMQDPEPRTLRNKAVEALTAMLLVERYGRERVMAQYLRIAPYGSSTRGIAFAARRYFDKPVADLSWAEIGFLAAIPQSPSRMNPYQQKGRKRAIARGRRILDLLRRAGVMSEDERALAEAQIRTLSIPRRPARPECAIHAVLRLERELAGAVVEAPIVRTTLDLDLMEQLYDVLDESVHHLAPNGANNAAMVIADRDTSEVVAYLGSVDWFDPSRAGAIDFAGTPRPSGSTLKPFVYALALDRGVITPATVLDDLFRARGGISNADDCFLGPLLPRVALANSRNVPAANLTEDVGLHPVYDVLAALQLHHRERPVEHYGVGVTVGLLPVTLFDLVSAYTALASDGRLRPLRFLPGEREARRIFSTAAARQVTGFLADPLARLPTFPRMGTSEYPFPVALKTGTSQGYRDAWTVAYTRRYLIGVWIGRADARPMHRVGGMSAAAIARRAVALLHAGDFDGLHDFSFPPPEGETPVRICALSGKVATHACEHTFVEYFPKGEEPLETCDVHVPVAVGPGEVRTFVRLPARFAEWARD